MRDAQTLPELHAACPAWTHGPSHPQHSRVRVLTHIKKLDDCFGQFLVRVSCVCGASRHIEPEALARLVGWRHTFASLGRTAGESAFNVARMMGHAKSTLVDQVYAHSMQSGMASVAENVTARALGVKPQLRVIEGGQRDVRQPLAEASEGTQKSVATA